MERRSRNVSESFSFVISTLRPGRKETKQTRYYLFSLVRVHVHVAVCVSNWNCVHTTAGATDEKLIREKLDSFYFDNDSFLPWL